MSKPQKSRIAYNTLSREIHTLVSMLEFFKIQHTIQKLPIIFVLCSLLNLYQHAILKQLAKTGQTHVIAMQN